jgi:hypothetical protein
MAEGYLPIKAAVVKEANGPFIFEDLLLDEPKNGEVCNLSLRQSLRGAENAATALSTSNYHFLPALSDFDSRSCLWNLPYRFMVS